MQRLVSNRRAVFQYKRFKQREKLSQSEKLRILGNKIRKSKEMYESKQFVLKRDNYTCTLCGCSNKKGKNKKPIRFQVHHIIRFMDDLENGNIKNTTNTSNMVTICPSCHKLINGKEELYKDYFYYVLSCRKYKEINYKKEEKEENEIQ